MPIPQYMNWNVCSMIKYPLEVNTSLVRVENGLHKLDC